MPVEVRSFVPADLEAFPALQAALGHGWESVLDRLTAYTMRDGETVLAMGGIRKDRTGVGEALIALTDAGRQCPITVARAARHILVGALADEYWRIYGTTVVGDENALKFLRWLGMKHEGTLRRFGIHQEDHELFALTRER